MANKQEILTQIIEKLGNVDIDKWSNSYSENVTVYHLKVDDFNVEVGRYYRGPPNASLIVYAGDGREIYNERNDELILSLFEDIRTKYQQQELQQKEQKALTRLEQFLEALE